MICSLTYGDRLQVGQPPDMLYRILIADDHELMRSAVRTVLETHVDWQVCGEASNGLEAVQKVAELKPDIVILDLRMPVMDGLRAAREISAVFPDVPIVMHTIYDSSSVVTEAHKNGVRQVVSKGSSARELLAAVERVLGGTPRPLVNSK